MAEKERKPVLKRSGNSAEENRNPVLKSKGNQC
jgi:hypothetical protein